MLFNIRAPVVFLLLTYFFPRASKKFSARRIKSLFVPIRSIPAQIPDSRGVFVNKRTCYSKLYTCATLVRRRVEARVRTDYPKNSSDFVFTVKTPTVKIKKKRKKRGENTGLAKDRAQFTVKKRRLLFRILIL